MERLLSRWYVNHDISPKKWQVLRLSTGRQYFDNADIGRFSITFTKAGGVNGDTQDGLHSPVIQLENLNNWEPLDVDAVVNAGQNDAHGNLCQSFWQDSSYRGWTCGIPKVGQAAFGISNIHEVPNEDNSYTKGRCTMHVVQYQRNEYGSGNDYAFDIVLYDAAQKQLAVKQKTPVDPSSKSLEITSALPLVVVIVADGNDHSKVTFKYGAQTWGCGDGTDTGGDHQCNLGGPGEGEWGYENGNRKGDMGFNC